MTKTDQKKNHIESAAKREFAKSQIEQALETFRALFLLLIQVSTVLVVADVTLVGYAITSKIAGILFVGALFPLMMFLYMQTAWKYMRPLLFSAVCLEYKYGGDNENWVATTFLSTLKSVEYIDKIRAISILETSSEKIAQLRKLPPPFMGPSSKTRIFLILVTIGQVIAPVTLSSCFEWRLF